MPFQHIPGYFNYEDLYRGRVINASNGARFVEIGSWLGRSTVFMAEAIKESGKQIDFYAVDHGIGSPDGLDSDILQPIVNEHGGTIIPQLARNIYDHGVADYVTLIVTKSVKAASLFQKKSLDFVYIDAGHEYEAVIADIYTWLPKIKTRGVLAGHDYVMDSYIHGQIQCAVHLVFGGWYPDLRWRDSTSWYYVVS